MRLKGRWCAGTGYGGPGRRDAEPVLLMFTSGHRQNWDDSTH